ncbi:MAG: hypothetical protein LBR96_03500 [Treponema sp.]|jgi:hypothetical protein|nr:hypothetical protein [Treponema sp.]
MRFIASIWEASENRAEAKTIYTVKGDIIPVQLIDSRELSAGENVWLRDLNDRLEAAEIRAITEAVQKEGKYGRIRAYLEAVYEANPEKVEEAFKMSDTVLTLEKVLENIGLTARWEERGIKKGEERGEEKKALEIVGNLLKMGLPAEQIAEASGLPVEKVRALSRP